MLCKHGACTRTARVCSQRIIIIRIIIYFGRERLLRRCASCLQRTCLHAFSVWLFLQLTAATAVDTRRSVEPTLRPAACFADNFVGLAGIHVHAISPGNFYAGRPRREDEKQEGKSYFNLIYEPCSFSTAAGRYGTVRWFAEKSTGKKTKPSRALRTSNRSESRISHVAFTPPGFFGFFSPRLNDRVPYHAARGSRGIFTRR